MRGLRLFIRPIEGADAAAIAAFLSRQTGVADAAGVVASVPAYPSAAADGMAKLPTQVPAWGLLGKLLGEVVAVVALDMTDDALRVDDLVVERDLRRKWIGRAMLREVEQLAIRMDRRRIVVEDAANAQEFLRRVGFESEGERWVRNL